EAVDKGRGGKAWREIARGGEGGFKSLEFDGLVGLLGPREVARAVRDRIAADIRQVVSDSDVETKLAATGQVVNPGTPAEFTEALEDQLKTVRQIGETLGIKPAQ